jgi:hypothetical protein
MIPIETWILLIWFVGTEPVLVRDYHRYDPCVEACEEWKKQPGAGCTCLQTLR